MLKPYACTLLAAALLSAWPYVSGSAHEGHEHGAPPTKASVTAAPRAEASSDLFELVAVARNGELIVHLDRFATNEPVEGAQITVETPQGSAEAKPEPDGSYRVAAPWSQAAGRWDLIFTVVAGASADVLTLTLEVPAGAAAGPRESSPRLFRPAFAGAIGEHIAAGSGALIAALIGGFLAGLLAMALIRRRGAVAIMLIAASVTMLAAASAHEGEDHSQPAPQLPGSVRDVAQLLPDGAVFVPKSAQRILAIRTVQSQAAVHPRTVELPGRIIPDPNASGYVQASVNGRLSPPEDGFPRLGTPVRKGDVLAYVTPPLQAIDRSDMQQRQGELDQQISIVERRLARYETLVPSGAVARTQLEDTKLELNGLRERRASLDRARRAPEALVAPVDGVIAEGSPVAGQIAQTNAVVFHIIDSSRLWVEALSYEALPGIQGGTARLRDRELKLSFRGAGFADRNQSIPIHFAIEGDVSGVRVGQLVSVLAATREEQRGLAVPRTGLVRNAAGQDIVYEHVAAERFEPRSVRFEPLDGQRVLISHGLAPGRRVVVQGAELIGQVR